MPCRIENFRKISIRHGIIHLLSPCRIELNPIRHLPYWAVQWTAQYDKHSWGVIVQANWKHVCHHMPCRIEDICVKTSMYKRSLLCASVCSESAFKTSFVSTSNWNISSSYEWYADALLSKFWRPSLTPFEHDIPDIPNIPKIGSKFFLIRIKIFRIRIRIKFFYKNQIFL